ncbi:MAG: SDR family oxidoreductase [Desulfatiglans sp.]|jgi:2-deoxy-D-gluconate 3-dehydrogenase|nr:SDR family oxidoreductase [Thermodesulfobacteriota bacterium]MEE4354524.1 SDR family oxidoreductase [Desulfatiglans sp.]
MSAVSLGLSDKVAVVTGGSRGLGHAIAVAMAQEGAKVMICGRKQENLDKAVEGFSKMGLKIASHAANVGDSGQVASLFADVKDRFGELDILVNNVGMNIFTPSVAEMDEKLWDKIIETNLKGTFLTSCEGIKIMKEGGGGKIINISSVAARKSAQGMGGYCVAKAGLEMLTKVLAAENAKDRINVNAVAPGMVKTPFSQPFWSNEKMLKQITATVPMGRIAETDDVVGAVLFLSSGLSDYITGEVITVDGGSMA